MFDEYSADRFNVHWTVSVKCGFSFRDNPIKGDIIKPNDVESIRSSYWNASKQTIIITHGWIQNGAACEIIRDGKYVDTLWAQIRDIIEVRWDSMTRTKTKINNNEITFYNYTVSFFKKNLNFENCQEYGNTKLRDLEFWKDFKIPKYMVIRNYVEWYSKELAPDIYDHITRNVTSTCHSKSD